MAANDTSDTRIRMMPARSRCLPLPQVPDLFPDELLSSWLRRTGVEYGVSIEQLAQHIGISETKSADIDHKLLSNEIGLLASTMRVERAQIRRRLHHPLRPAVSSLRAHHAPIQICASCRAMHFVSGARLVVLRAWFEFWRIECQECQKPMSSLGAAILNKCNPALEYPRWFSSVMPIARRGAARLHAFARRPMNVTLSPVSVLCLLSRPLPLKQLENDFLRYGPYRVADLFVPGLSELTREEGTLIPETWTTKKPVQLVTARIILLAGLSNFLNDPPASIRRVQDAMDRRRGSFLDHWIETLPPHAQSLLFP